MTQAIARPMRPPEETLSLAGVPAHARQRWQREIERCTTTHQLHLTAHCHQMEAYLYARYGA